MKLASLLFFTLIAVAIAQTPTPSPTAAPSRLPIWRCELPGGIYEAAVRSIVSVSTQDYVVDGAARVTEVNVDTSGTFAVRFYYIEPLTPNSPLGIGQSTINKLQDLAKEAAGRVDQDNVWQKVVKSYPTTTHAKTIEYRVESKDQIDKIFTSAEKAFRLGISTTVKP